MAKILDRIHVIEGIGKPDSPLNVFLIEEKGGQLTLVDTGLPGFSPKILEYLQRNGFKPEQIRRILVTHCHRDHVGSLKAMIDATKAKSISHWLEAAFIAQNPVYDGPPGSPPNWDPVRVDEVVKDGDELDVLGGVEVLHTPGHTPGHISFYSKELGILFIGDLLFNKDNKLILTPPEYTQHTQSAMISARRVVKLQFEHLLTYHGPPIVGGARQKVEALVSKL